MCFAADVIVMAIYRVAVRAKRWQERRDSAQYQAHHFVAVEPRILLRPIYGGHVIHKMLTAFGEVGEVFVGQVVNVFAHIFFRKCDKVTANRIADATTARVKHDPHIFIFIDAHFNKVIAAAERAQLLGPGGARLVEHLHHGRMFFK